jgi:hypothetical protein
MNDSLTITDRPRTANCSAFDAIIIGAGISGIFMLYRAHARTRKSLGEMMRKLSDMVSQ